MMSDYKFMKLLKDKKVADAYQYFEASVYKLYLAELSYSALETVIAQYQENEKTYVEKVYEDALTTGKGAYKVHTNCIEYFGTQVSPTVMMDKLTKRNPVSGRSLRPFRSRDRNPQFYTYLFSDVYYGNLEKTNGMFLFIPYETLTAFGSPSEENEVMRCVCRGLFEDEETYRAVRYIAGPEREFPGSSSAKNNKINVFESIIRDAQYTVNLVTMIIFGILIVCFLIACLFVSSQVRIELFYRRKELGFLQIFGVGKKRVRTLVITGYLLKILYSVGVSLAVYCLCLAGYGAGTGRLLLFHPIHAPLLILLITGFYLWSVSRATAGFLKKSTMELITG